MMLRECAFRLIVVLSFEGGIGLFQRASRGPMPWGHFEPCRLGTQVFWISAVSGDVLDNA